MDPNASWRILVKNLQLLTDTPRDEEARMIAVVMLESLADWIRRGGFSPTVQ